MSSHAKAAAASSTHRENRTFSLGVIAAMLVCAAAFLGIGAPAASAAVKAQPGFEFSEEFGAADLTGDTNEVNPITVDSNGNVIASDWNFSKIKVFAPDRSLLTEFSAGSVLQSDLAVDLNTHALYVQDPGYNSGTPTIRRWLSDGNPTPTYTLDPTFEAAAGRGIRVDPTTGNLLVAEEGAGVVQRYDSTGALADTIETPGIAPHFLAVAPDGSIYVAQESGAIGHFSGTGTLLGEFEAGGGIEGLGFDPLRELVVVAMQGGALRVLSPAGAFLSATETGRENRGPDFDASGRLYTRRPSASQAAIYVYDPVTVPGLEAPAVTGIETTSAHFSAEVDPGDGPPADSEAHFEYSADGGNSWTSTASQSLSAAGEVEADVTALDPNFEYLVRTVASNAGTTRYSSTTSFSTAAAVPAVQTKNATDVAETSAVLNGTINPFGLQTTYYFEYGTSTSYGTKVPAGIEAVAGDGREPRAFLRSISGLQPGTEYHFRIVAKNAVGVSEGADETFVTAAAGGIIHRVYEQATPKDKHGIPVEPNFGFYAKPDGNGIAYIVKNGQNGSPLNARAVNFRGTDNWGDGIDLDPTLNVYTGPGILTQATLGLAADFSQAFVVSNRVFAPGAVEGAANLYLRDVSAGTYTFVGKTPPLSFALNTFTGFGYGGNLLQGAPDFSWILFYSEIPLLENAPFDALYRWSESKGLEVVSVLPGPSETEATIFAPSSYDKVLRVASSDGSRIYFTSESPEPGVYLREDGATRAVSVSEVGSEPTGPQPARLIAVSKDGRYAFFGIAENGVKLTADAPGTFGDLYRYDASDNSLEYLGTQIGGDFIPASTYHSAYGAGDDGQTLYFRTESNDVKVWRDGQLKTALPRTDDNGLAGNGFRVSPSGRYLVYAGSTGGGVYLYDAETEETSCVSCTPNGNPGAGYLANGTNRTIGEYLPQVVTDAGQVFFTSPDRLVAADVNGVDDVYEFQGGKNTLISPGNAPFPATYADISDGAKDVFFTTSQKLVGQDNDGTVDIYDARIGGGLAGQNPAPPQECLRDDCKATPNAGPELPFGGSEALSGPENVKPVKHKKCGKGKRAKKVKGKVRCVKKHQAKKHRANKAGKGGNR